MKHRFLLAGLDVLKLLEWKKHFREEGLGNWTRVGLGATGVRLESQWFHVCFPRRPRPFLESVSIPTCTYQLFKLQVVQHHRFGPSASMSSSPHLEPPPPSVPSFVHEKRAALSALANPSAAAFVCRLGSPKRHQVFLVLVSAGPIEVRSAGRDDQNGQSKPLWQGARWAM